MLNRWLDRLRSGPPALATVYLRAGRLLVQTSDRTEARTAGFWIAAATVISLDAASTTPVAIGQAVLDALARSRVDVPVPERGADLEAPLWKAAGVRSRRAFMEGTRACSVNRERTALRIDPLRNGGTSGDARGFSPLSGAETRTLDAAAPAPAIGQAVLEALERSTMAATVPGVS